MSSDDQNQPADPPGLDPAIEAAAFTASGLAMVPFGDDDEHNYFEWHECIDQPNCSTVRYGDPCACSGMPWPSEAVQVAVRAAAPALRAGALRDAADEIQRDWADPYGGVVARKLRERADRIGGAT